MKYEKLFTPGKLGSMTVKNRIVMPPMGTGMAAADGEANDQTIDSAMTAIRTLP